MAKTLTPIQTAAHRLIASGETLEPRATPYIPSDHWPPHVRQAVFLSPPVTLIREVLYGGAAGGGKSDALLMGALQYVDVPGYAAMILRRTYADLAIDGALMNRAEKWLRPTDARWNQTEKRWTFPSGATVSFGYMEHAGDEQRYASAEFQYIGFDELTQFAQAQYQFMFSRLRRVAGMGQVPLRMRSATNPMPPGKEWVHQRFILERAPGRRLFIPARLEDNPSLDADEYEASLRELGDVNFRRLRFGDWDVQPEGLLFKRAWFEEHMVNAGQIPEQALRVRYWDLAATGATPKGSLARRMGDPDSTAGLRMSRTPDGMSYVEDVVRGQLEPHDVERLVADTAAIDGREVPIRMEEEGGGSGKGIISHYRRNVVPQYDFAGIRSTGSKETRATPVAARAQAGEICVVRAEWTNAFLDEVAEFPEGLHDDQVDALSGAYGYLAARGARGRGAAPTGFTSPSAWLNT